MIDLFVSSREYNLVAHNFYAGIPNYEYDSKSNKLIITCSGCKEAILIHRQAVSNPHNSLFSEFHVSLE